MEWKKAISDCGMSGKNMVVAYKKRCHSYTHGFLNICRYNNAYTHELNSRS
jgi:hypothetical protein